MRRACWTEPRRPSCRGAVVRRARVALLSSCRVTAVGPTEEQTRRREHNGRDDTTTEEERAAAGWCVVHRACPTEAHRPRFQRAASCGVCGCCSRRRAASSLSSQSRRADETTRVQQAATRQPKTRSWVVRCARRTERPRHHGTVVRRAWATLSLSNCVLDVRYIKGKKGNDGAIATGVITNDPTRRAPCGVASWRHSREDARHQRGLSYAVRIVVRVW